jgi:hypothetical protein
MLVHVIMAAAGFRARSCEQQRAESRHRTGCCGQGATRCHSCQAVQRLQLLVQRVQLCGAAACSSW